jgi:predicted nucleic acid-binding protein
MSGSFFDSNVLVYAATKDPRKAERARNLMEIGGVVSVQVLNEVANVTLKKKAMAWSEIHAFLALIRDLLEIHAVDVSIHDRGLAIAERYRLSIYDAMIAAAALQTGCETLYSEDMHDGLLIDGRLRVTNPFAVAT